MAKKKITKAKPPARPAPKKSAKATSKGKATPKKAATKKAAVKKAPAKKTVVKKVTKKAVKKVVVVKKAVKKVASASAKASASKSKKAVKSATQVQKIVKKAPLKVVKTVPKAAVKPAKPTVRSATKKTPSPTPKLAVVKSGPAASPRVVEKTSPAPRKEPTLVKSPPKKVPLKERVVMEFYLNSSPTALYDQLSTPSGFSEWYCQDVDVRGDQYTFIWDREREETTMIGRKQGEVIRFRRNDDDDPEAFFEFRVRVDPMTNEVCLVVTDHAWPDEVVETRQLWDSQIHELKRVLGA
ncbi:MAG: hypothetical protein IPH05_04785 [Flavobacteriales bacterium]|jgi:hypothetical protein|nr:hypothetical protein [Flavobacteriales bacterium]MBK6551723.1 hypothetical protein [Flavobacteriales bacterium]MBK6882250.1 hypothetical protein [Flavobacteriales bacterium]MBK7101533.1 hypothetical protein [Flavobacteriales bacterium]MBK7618739.1 hypothetical protein [Flavobacteriales bacterium]